MNASHRHNAEQKKPSKKGANLSEIQIKVKTNLWWQENRTVISLGNEKGGGI